MLVLALGVITTSSAQKGKKEDRQKLTPEQRTELAVKKMTLKLDLTPSQANQIKPLLLKQTNERKAMREKRKEMKEKGTKLSSDERYALKSKKLDNMIAFKAEMKRILNEKQYEKFEKIANRKMKKGKKGKKGKHKRGDRKKHRG